MNEKAAIIQRAWSTSFQFKTTKKIATHALALGISTERAARLSLGALITLTRETVVIYTTKLLIQRFHRIAIRRHGFPLDMPIQEARRVTVRIFLIAIVMTAHPTGVFVHITAREHRVLECARRITTTFDTMTAMFASGDVIPHETTKNFIADLLTYLSNFHDLTLSSLVLKEAKLKCAVETLEKMRKRTPEDPSIAMQAKRLKAIIARLRTN